ncbi:hypothetical protein [Hymenobacter sp. APR13]|uniref:hypothetical protein n=1 Tax=Hymenobacter sp. APR13 TaxID=1356852 RepID=UPI0012E08733|nr:hypothetical protein [Hymenobacter sp. APR13]
MFSIDTRPATSTVVSIDTSPSAGTVVSINTSPAAGTMFCINTCPATGTVVGSHRHCRRISGTDAAGEVSGEARKLEQGEGD